MRIWRCEGCGILNGAINNLDGFPHIQTGRKPSGCEGRYRLDVEATATWSRGEIPEGLPRPPGKRTENR